ncbi:hypothetical protein HIM_00218 [Hirsutella minnesotensis 3608]|nr:hypothetical protein HIM_00218 [Hirsutella minnesotensis 3608]
MDPAASAMQDRPVLPVLFSVHVILKSVLQKPLVLPIGVMKPPRPEPLPGYQDFLPPGPILGRPPPPQTPAHHIPIRVRTSQIPKIPFKGFTFGFGSRVDFDIGFGRVGPPNGETPVQFALEPNWSTDQAGLFVFVNYRNGGTEVSSSQLPSQICVSTRLALSETEELRFSLSHAVVVLRSRTHSQDRNRFHDHWFQFHQQCMQRQVQLNRLAASQPGNVKRAADCVIPDLPGRRQLTSTDSIHNAIAFLDQIGSGQTGTVHRAIDRTTGAVFAVKRFKRYDPARVAYALRLDRINHNNVVKYHSFLLLTGSAASLVMELCSGRNLRDEMRTRRLSNSEIRVVLHQLLDALVCVHSHEIVHGGIKPTNILFISRNPIHVKLTDSGLEPSSKMPGDLLKRPSYAAPEVLIRDPGPSFDIWSLGVTGVEIAHGLPDHHGTKVEDWPEKLLRHLYTKAPGRLSQLLSTMLLYIPGIRPTAGDCLEHGYFTEMDLPLRPLAGSGRPSTFPYRLSRSASVVSLASRRPSAGGGLEAEDQAPPNDLDLTWSPTALGPLRNPGDYEGNRLSEGIAGSGTSGDAGPSFAEAQDVQGGMTGACASSSTVNASEPHPPVQSLEESTQALGVMAQCSECKRCGVDCRPILDQANRDSMTCELCELFGDECDRFRSVQGVVAGPGFFKQGGIYFVKHGELRISMAQTSCDFNATSICNAAGLTPHQRLRLMAKIKQHGEPIKTINHAAWISFRDGVFLCQRLQLQEVVAPLLARVRLAMPELKENYLLAHASMLDSLGLADGELIRNAAFKPGYMAVSWGGCLIFFTVGEGEVNVTHLLRWARRPVADLRNFFVRRPEVNKRLLQVGRCPESGTYVSLAVGRALCEHFQLPLDPLDMIEQFLAEQTQPDSPPLR